MRSLTFNNRDSAILMKSYSKKMTNQKNIEYRLTKFDTVTNHQQVPPIFDKPSHQYNKKHHLNKLKKTKKILN